MKHIKFITIILITAIIVPIAKSAGIRNELARYTLLRDRVIIDRSLKRDQFQSFFDFDLNISSGVKKMISDVKENTRNESNPTIKQANIVALLNKYINTEKFLDLDLTAAIPSFWKIKISNIEYLPAIFYNINFGLSLSFSNLGDATNPMAQTYLKLERKMGLHTAIKIKKTKRMNIAVYKLLRGDSNFFASSSKIASDNKLFTSDDLTDPYSSYNLDVQYIRDLKHYTYLLEFQELHLKSSSEQSAPFPKYGKNPLFHIRYTWKNNHSNSITRYSPFAGIHFRRKYTIDDGVYLGINLDIRDIIPFYFIGKLSNDFMTLTSQLKSKYFQFSYTLKTPIRNPQNEIWVPTIHSIAMNFPFP